MHDPWMPTSRERLAMHLVHAHGEAGEAEVDGSKAQISVAHRLGWPNCPWTSTHPDTRPNSRNWRR